MPPGSEPWCSACPEGWASTSVDAGFCQMCTPGTYAASAQSPACSACPAGAYANTWGTAACKHCIMGTFSNSTVRPRHTVDVLVTAALVDLAFVHPADGPLLSCPLFSTVLTGPNTHIKEVLGILCVLSTEGSDRDPLNIPGGPPLPCTAPAQIQARDGSLQQPASDHAQAVLICARGRCPLGLRPHAW